MEYTVDKNLRDFNFWSGAKYTASKLTHSELNQLEDLLYDVFGEETPTETEINDLFWFEEDTIAQLLGYEDWDDLESDRD